MNWGFHFHILGPRARAHQDPKDFEEPSRVFNPQWAQFLQWLWCYRYRRNTWYPHTQAWTVSVTATWATTPWGGGGESPANGPVVGGGVGTEAFCTGHWRLHIDGGQGWDSGELSHQHQFWFTQPLRGSATPFCLTGTSHFLLNERQALHVLACGSVTQSRKCDLN